MRRAATWPRRWRSAVIISISWRRRATSSPRVRAAASGTGRGADRLGEVGDHRGGNPSRQAAMGPGIQRIGLGEPAGGAGEGADLARIDHRQRQPGRGQGPGDHRFAAAGGLQHDQARLAAQLGQQALQPGGVATGRDPLALGAQMHLEPALGNVDADKHRVVLWL
jgi:hypothetical protein